MKKQPKDYGWVILAIMLGTAIISYLTGCTPPAQSHKGQTECRVLEGWPLVMDADLDPVYIPVDMDGRYKSGDTVWIDENGIIQEMLIRDSDSGQPDTSNLERVVLKDPKDLPNKWIPDTILGR